jgi:hypothetical protein
MADAVAAEDSKKAKAKSRRALGSASAGGGRDGEKTKPPLKASADGLDSNSDEGGNSGDGDASGRRFFAQETEVTFCWVGRSGPLVCQPFCLILELFTAWDVWLGLLECCLLATTGDLFL